jgi:hypothetical protein
VAAQPLWDSNAAGSASNGNSSLEQTSQVHSRLRSRPIHLRFFASWCCELHCKAGPSLHRTAQHSSTHFVPTICKGASSALLMTCCLAERRLHLPRAQRAGTPTQCTPRMMLADTSQQGAHGSVAFPRSASQRFGCPSGCRGAASRERLTQQSRILPLREDIACSRRCGRLEPRKLRGRKWKAQVDGEKTTSCCGSALEGDRSNGPMGTTFADVIMVNRTELVRTPNHHELPQSVKPISIGNRQEFV